MPSCEPGHMPPDWNVAAMVAAAPVEGRCIEPDPQSNTSVDNGWYLCGGLRVSGGHPSPLPEVCPIAPGGLEVAFGSQPSGDYRSLYFGRAVVLDCPGRYAARLDGQRVSVVLVDAGIDACRTSSYFGLDVGADGQAIPPTGSPEIDGQPLLPLRERVAPEFVALLPDALRNGFTDDTSGYKDNVWGRLAWAGGRVNFQAGALELVVGQESAWNRALFTGTWDPGSPAQGEWHLLDVLVRFQPRRRLARTRDGRALVLETWARLRLDAAGGELIDAIPVRLPEARVCGVALPAGTKSFLSDAAAPPTDHPRCGKRPEAAPHHVTFGADWATVAWSDLGAVRPPDVVDWFDPGCEIRCGGR